MQCQDLSPDIHSLTCPTGTATVGQAYASAFTASGGLQPLTWSIISGSLPTGLTLLPDGTLSGTPITAATFSFTAQVSDSGEQPATATKVCSIIVSELAVCGTMTYKWSYNSLTGPFWQSSVQNTFFAVGIDTANAKKLVAWTSTNYGDTWTKVDDSNAPIVTNNIISFEARYDSGSSVLVATMEATTGRVAYHRVNMNTSVWAIINKQVIASVSSAHVGSGGAGVSVDKRTNGNIGVYYTSDDETVSGTPYGRSAVKESSNDGTTWGSAIDIGGVLGTAHTIDMSRIQHGTGNRFHFFFGLDLNLLAFPPQQVQTLNNANSLSSPVTLAALRDGQLGGRPTSYNDGTDKIAIVMSWFSAPVSLVATDVDTPVVVTNVEAGTTATVIDNTTLCGYPMATLDYVSGKLYMGLLSNHIGTPIWNYEMSSTDGATWTPTDESLQIGPTHGVGPDDAQHGNSLVFTFGGVVYRANISEGDSFTQLFQMVRVALLPYPNPPQNIATWLSHCS